MQLLELVGEHLRKRLGVRKIPLSYVIRDLVPVARIGMINADAPYSDEFKTFHEELIAQASHNHPNYPEDNATILDTLVGCFKTTC